jgi:hypothetical protein
MMSNAAADVIQVQFGGTLNYDSSSASFWDSSVQLGTVYSYTYTFDSTATAVGGPDDTAYFSPDESPYGLSLTLGDYTFAEAGTYTEIRDNASGGPLLDFGSNDAFTQNGLTFLGGHGIQAYVGGNSIPDTALSNVQSIPLSSYPFSVFALSGFFNLNDGSITTPFDGYSSYDDAAIQGNVTRYTVTDLTTAPEPSTYALVLGGLVLLSFCARRKLI